MGELSVSFYLVDYHGMSGKRYHNHPQSKYKSQQSIFGLKFNDNI